MDPDGMGEPDLGYLKGLLESDELAESLREPFAALSTPTGKRPAANRLAALAQDFPEDFDEPALRALVSFLGDREVGNILGTIYLRLVPTASDTLWEAGNRAAWLVVQNPFQPAAVYTIIARAVGVGKLDPTMQMVEALLMQLEHNPERWHLAHGEDEAFKACAGQNRAMVEELVLKNLLLPERWRVGQAATGARLLAQGSRRGVQLMRVTEALLNALERRCQGFLGGQDDELYDIVRALQACLARGPHSVSRLLMRRMGEWGTWTVRYPAQVFRCALPATPRESWLPLVLGVIGDPGADMAARNELADAVAASADQSSAALDPFFPACIETLVRVIDEMEAVIARGEEDALISFTVSRVRNIATAAGRGRRSSALEVLATAIAKVQSDVVVAALLILTGELASGDRTLSARVVPIGAAHIRAGEPLQLVLGGVRLLSAVVERSPSLLPANVVAALIDCLRWSQNEYIQSEVLALFEKARVTGSQALAPLFEAMDDTLDVWLQTGCGPEAVGALLSCARERASGSEALHGSVGSLAKKAAQARDGEVALAAFDEYQVAAAWWPELQGEFLDSWMGAAWRRQGVLFSSGGDRLFWIYQFEADSLRSRADELLALADGAGDVYDVRDLAGLFWSFGMYEPLTKVLRQVTQTILQPTAAPQELRHRAMALAVEAELELASGTRERALDTLDQAVAVSEEFERDVAARRAAAFRGEGEPSGRLAAMTGQGDPWLGRWLRFRDAWHETFGLPQQRPSVIEVTRLFRELEGFGPDDWDNDCSTLVSNILDGVTAAVLWYDAVRLGEDTGPALKAKFELHFGEAESVAKALSEHRMPSSFAPAYAELVKLAEGVRPATGIVRLMEAVAALPLPVPRLGVRVYPQSKPGRNSDRTGSARVHPRPSKEPELLAKVRVTLDGNLLGPRVEPIEPQVVHALKFEFEFGRLLPTADLVTELVTTYPVELFRFQVQHARVGAESRHAEVLATLIFDRPLAFGAEPLSMQLGAYLQFADGQTKNITPTARQGFSFRVETSKTEPVQEGNCSDYVRPTRLHITARCKSRRYDVEVGQGVAAVGREALSRFVRLLRGAYVTADGWLSAETMFEAYQPDKVACDQAFNRIKEFLRKGLGADADCLLVRDGRGKMRVDVSPEAISWDDALVTLQFEPLRQSVRGLAAAREQWRRGQSPEST